VSKIPSVALAEYGKAVRTKAFIIGIIMMPILFGISIIGLAISEKTKDVDDRHFAVVDRSGDFYPLIEKAVEERNQSSVFDDEGGQEDPRWIPELYVPAGDGSGKPAELALSERVESGELLGFLVIGADLFELPEDGATLDRELSWHTDTPTYDDLPDWLGSEINGAIKQRRFKEADVDQALIARLERWERVRTLGLTEVDETTGEIKAAEETSKIVILMPLALGMLLFMLVMMSTPALLNNVLEEKMQKIAEVLVSSVSPFELLMGKLFSAVLVALTLGALYLGGLLLFVHNAESLVSVPIPPQIFNALGWQNMAWFGLFLLLALLIFGSMFSALGSACSELQDAQTLMMPATIMIVLPMMFLSSVPSSRSMTMKNVAKARSMS